MTARFTIPAFSAYGIELEYAIVARDSLDVLAAAPELLGTFAGRIAADVDRDGLGWSNELAAHVVELKNVAPTPALEALARGFQDEVRVANGALSAIGAHLMPTAMHPWMAPKAETELWPHEGSDIYRTFDRIFDCRRHGWANIQSMHFNLPFADDHEFARLHAAVRLLLPLVPALAASSPVADGAPTGFLDSRLEAYCGHAGIVPAITGAVIPENVASRADYEQRILGPMYRAIEPRDPAGVLRNEWLNARGAIARFERNAIEVRLTDTQECPQADIAIAAATAAVIRSLYAETPSTLSRQQTIATEALRAILTACIRDAERAVVDDARFLDLLGVSRRPCRAGEAWQHLLEAAGDGREWWRPVVAFIFERGTLARRILRAVDGDFSRDHLRTVYERLCDCLERGERFE